jgi:uroporphyrinogen-III decarboxylase
MSFCEGVVYEYARAMQKAGADTVSIGDSYAGPNLISPADYRRLAWPHERELIRRVQRDFQIPFHLHICGRANPLVADMARTGAMVLEVDQCTDLATAWENVRESKTVLHGNIDPERCMFATPEEIRRLTQQAIRDMNGGRGLIVGPGCALGGSTPSQNIAALVQAAHDCGRFD